MFSLTDLCLNRITEDPARCLRRGEETQPALLRPASDTFLRCEAQSIPRDRWAAVEQSTSAARRRPRPEARPQLLATLAARGALVDGVLPPKFFESLRVDTLSLAAVQSKGAVSDAGAGASEDGGDAELSGSRVLPPAGRRRASNHSGRVRSNAKKAQMYETAASSRTKPLPHYKVRVHWKMLTWAAISI